MLEVLCPSLVAGSVCDIDLDDLARRNIRALILDLDNTLLGWDAVEMSPGMDAWVREAKRRGFRLCIASNGLDSRVSKIAANLGIPAIAKATKPRKKPFRQALAILGVPSYQAAVIGDQVFTDVLGGNRMEIFTILINPISRKELGTTRLVRRVERRVLRALHRKGLLHEAALRLRQGD